MDDRRELELDEYEEADDYYANNTNRFADGRWLGVFFILLIAGVSYLALWVLSLLQGSH